MIGGRQQTGQWKIDARYNKAELVRRIEAIARLRGRVFLSREDARKFLARKLAKVPAKSLIYLDPPYYEKGKDLYFDFYSHGDHALISNFVTKKIQKQRWIVSYDNVKPIRQLYNGHSRITYSIGYSARDVRTGSEAMFFSSNIKVPPLTGPLEQLSRRIY
jgi:DNA adenine methylase